VRARSCRPDGAALEGGARALHLRALRGHPLLAGPVLTSCRSPGRRGLAEATSKPVTAWSYARAQGAPRRDLCALAIGAGLRETLVRRRGWPAPRRSPRAELAELAEEGLGGVRLRPPGRTAATSAVSSTAILAPVTRRFSAPIQPGARDSNRGGLVASTVPERGRRAFACRWRRRERGHGARRRRRNENPSGSGASSTSSRCEASRRREVEVRKARSTWATRAPVRLGEGGGPGRDRLRRRGSRLRSAPRRGRAPRCGPLLELVTEAARLAGGRGAGAIRLLHGPADWMRTRRRSPRRDGRRVAARDALVISPPVRGLGERHSASTRRSGCVGVAPHW